MGKTLKIIAITLVTIMILYLIASAIVHTPYEAHYQKVMGFAEPRCLYADLQRDFGAPVNTEKTSDGVAVVSYPGFSVCLTDTTVTAGVSNVTVYDVKYRFGRKKIGVGSTAEDVRKAYKHVRKSPDAEYTYIDGSVYVRFFFDQNERVKEILLAW